MSLFNWKDYFWRKIYRTMSAILIGVMTMSGLFPHVDVLAAEYRQEKMSLSLNEIINETPDHPRIRLIAQILDLLPPQHYEKLLTIDYNPVYSDRPRGMAKEDHVILNSFYIENDQELVGVLIHEIGHVTDLGFLVDKAKIKFPSEFTYGNFIVTRFDPSRQFYQISWKNAYTRKSTMTTDDFISTYSMTNPFEDFAESYNFFVLHRNNFEVRALENQSIASKLKFLEKQVFAGQIYDFYGAENYPKLIYDTTLLPFDIGKLVAYIEDRDARRKLSGRTLLRRQARITRKIIV